MRVTNISGLRAHIKDYVDSVLDYGIPVIVNRGEDAVVMISLDEYNSVMATKHVLSTDSLYNALKKGLEESKNNETIEIDLDAL